MGLSADEISLVKGMIARGDRQSDIASYFGTNSGRVSEIKTGKRGSDVAPAPKERLPIQGPYFVNDEKPSRVKFNSNNKFDLQLSAAIIREQNLAHILANGKIELKTESWQWERTGNICIEFEQRGSPSGIAVTEADIWVHELRRADKTLVYLFFPVERLKELCRQAHRAGSFRTGVGDGGRFSVILLRLSDILK